MCFHKGKGISRNLYFPLISAIQCICHGNETFGTYIRKENLKGDIITILLRTPQKTCKFNLCYGKIQKALHQNTLDLLLLYIPLRLSTATRYSSCHAIFKVQIYLKYVSAIHSHNLHFRPDF